jgi:hypothetical protein
MFPDFSHDSRYKENPKAPTVRFVKIRGRVVPIVNGHKKVSLSPLVEGRLNELKFEVKHAERGQRGVFHNRETGISKNFATTSTFPGWYSQIGFKNKDDFEKVLVKRKSKKFDVLVEKAISDLNRGYDTSHGEVPPNMEFRVKTRQAFDNRGVVFRKIDGKVRPLRFLMNRTQKHNYDEVPF